jgi:hypothetical protein
LQTHRHRCFITQFHCLDGAHEDHPRKLAPGLVGINVILALVMSGPMHHGGAASMAQVQLGITVAGATPRLPRPLNKVSIDF